ncbi:MAG: RNA ligase [Anaerolineaceae bacterium 4572_78]|nr:MAG: RNA ligase [Anaerolineaceae bacterium 4572_78]
MRKLASIQKIKALNPIEGADLIERATVLGWQLVVKKGETVKMRGQISQGIAFPLNVIENRETMELEDGLDVTDIIGITKYEPPISADLRSKVKGGFPSFMPKTDETRIQSVPDVLTRPENQGKQCYITEKMDGTSATYYLKDGEFGVCSRNLDLLETEKNVHWKVARQEDIENKLQTVGYNIAIQGEIIGPGIQKNKYKLPKYKLVVFNAFNIDDYKYLNYVDFVALIQKLGLETVPILRDDYILGQDDVNALVAMSQAKGVLNPKSHREGIVIRPVVESQDFELGRLSFKVVNPKFLLKFE